MQCQGALEQDTCGLKYQLEGRSVKLLCPFVREKKNLPIRLRFYRCSIVLILKWRHAVRLTSQTAKYIYYINSIYISLFTLKYVVDPELSLQKCQISLKSLFLRVHQISEPNAALWNVGGRRLHVQGRIMGLPNGYLPFFLCSRFSSWPQTSERVETFTESEFSHKRESDVWKSRHLKGSETRFTRC